MATFTNQAALNYNGNVINSNIVTGRVVDALTVTKTSVTDNYNRGETLTYVVNLGNTGSTELMGIQISDTLGAYTFNENTVYPLNYRDGDIKLFVDGVLQATPTVASSSPLTVTGITVPANSVATLVYRVDVNDYAPPAAGSEIVNTVTATGAGLAEAVSAQESVTASALPLLNIEKALSPETVSANDTLTYTFTVRNFGTTAVSPADVTVTDNFDPVLSNIAVTLNGSTISSAGNYTYNEATGSFATVAGLFEVPAATFSRESDGKWTVSPGVAVITVSGRV